MLPTSKDESLNELQNLNFRFETQLQITKDFAIHGFEFHPLFHQETLEIDTLVNDVMEAIVYFLEHKFTSWQPLLYTIDISEKNYKKHLSTESNDWVYQFAWAIIKREAQKVFFKKHYK